MMRWCVLLLLVIGCSSEGANVPADTGDDCRPDSCRTCVPSCDGKECGDDGCGGECGSCLEGFECVAGSCTEACLPVCGMAQCGDDGCGGTCGECEGETKCKEGLCVPDCQPACEAKECGDDGCGGSCGDCPGAAPLCVDGTCQADCEHACDDKECGPDGCGGSCGDCGEGHVCLADGSCTCQPACDENECGDDGCGGSCGSCNGAQVSCVDGQCLCAPACDGKECGDDGCGGVCGTCPPSHDCLESGSCICVPDCTEKQCGGDGCTGLCGECACGENCTLDGQCLFTACVGKECGSDGCGGSCGSCQEGQYCVAGTCPPDGDICTDGNDVDWDGCTDGDLSEFQVPEVTADDQSAPAVAMLVDGAFAVAWQSDEEDGNGPGLFARFFGADGVALGAPVGVTEETYGAQKQVALTAGDNAYFAVWESTGQDGFMEGVFARAFKPDGKVLCSELQVNQFTQAAQLFPTAVALGDQWLVLWQTPSKDGSGTAVVGRILASDCTPDDDEFIINEELLHDQGGPAGAAWSDGRRVLTWNSFQQDGSSWGIAARRFAANGDPSGAEFIANTTTSSEQVWPAVATLDETDFVVVWQSLGQDTEGTGLFGQRFGPSYKLGSEFALNATGAGDQSDVAIASLPGGGFAAAWQSCPALGSQVPGQDGAGCGVIWRRFDAQAKPSGAEQVVSVWTTGDQGKPALAAAGETIVVAWQSCPEAEPSSGQDGDGCGVFARRFEASGMPLYH